MLSQAQIQRVWEGMLSSEVRAYYFAELTETYNRLQRYTTWATLFFSSGALAALLADMPDELKIIRPILAAITAAVSLYAVVAQNNKRAVDAADLHMRWNRLAHDYERIWENIEDPDAPRFLDDIVDRAAELSKAGTAFPNKTKSLMKWEDHVVGHRLQHQT